MRRLLRPTLVILLLAGSVSSAGPVTAFCPYSTNPTCTGDKCDTTKSCIHVGDPVNIADGNTYLRQKDISLKTSLGEVKLLRTYNSFEKSFDESTYADMPKPFGMYNGNTAWLRWWHNFYAAVYVNSADKWYVRDTDGRRLTFSGCAGPLPFSSTECWATPYTEDRSVRARLKWTGDGFILYHENGQRLIYTAKYYRDGETPSNWGRYFLTEIQTMEGQTLATIAYEQPPAGLSCPLDNNPLYSTPGTPYVRTVTTVDGSRMTFNYKSLGTSPHNECVIDNVTVLDRASDGGVTEQTAVTFTYGNNLTDAGTETPGFVRKVTFAERPDAGTETYGYSSAAFTVSNGSTVVSQSNYDSNGYVTSASTLSENLNITWETVRGLPDGGRCEPDSYCQNDVFTRHVTDTTLQAGDGTDAGSGFTRDYVVMGMYPQIHEPRLYESIDSCTNPNSCSPGRWARVWSQGDLNNSVNPLGIKDKRDNWIAYSYADAGVAGFRQLREKRAEYVGATGPDGGSALEVTRYGYVYSTDADQLVDYTEMDSVLGSSGSSARTKIVYDSATNRVKARIRHGWTRVRNGFGNWVTEERYIGKFYFTNHACESGTADPLGRTVEVHGPCLVSGFSATDCDVNTSGGVPIAQYEYWPSTDVSNRANQRKKVSGLTSNGGPGSCSGADKLEMTYDAYDARGNVTSVTDPNGVTTTYTYEENRVTSLTRSGLTTTFAYDNQKLTSIHYPEGNYEVLCYRTGTPGAACSGGNWTDKLQWRAKSESSDGATWSEKMVYSYWPDGTTASETYRAGCSTGCSASSGEIRRVVKYAADGHRRPTWRGWGDDTGQFAGATYFDKANNLSGLGLPFNDPPAFCGGANSAGLPTSDLCSSLGYDRANRLVSVDEYPSTSSPAARTCLQYDAQGNVSGMVTGCASATTVGDCSSCTNPSSSYQYDDFGNVVAVTLPWLGDSGGAGTIHYEFDAMGNMIKKETPTMADSDEYLLYLYDLLSRPIAVYRHYTQPTPGDERLYGFAYDDDATLDSSCPQPTNNMGRALYRVDSFGETWYQYDVWGRVTKEIRLRTGATTCSADPHDNPHTTYTYSSNGNLTSIVYPYGRTVTYHYGTGAYTDRVSSISVTSWSGSAWTTHSNIIASVLWEPYGDLRGYQINHPASANSSAVEYLQGGDGSSTPSGCLTTAPSSSDHTGRLRALWVSTGSFSAGSGGGNIYNRTYTWKADQVTQTKTCLLGSGTPTTEDYEYDQMLRLTAARRPSGNFSATGGAFEQLEYTLDGRGNRTHQRDEACDYNMTFDTGGRLDRLLSVSSGCTDSLLEYDYAYDKDGRVSSKSTPPDTWGNNPLSMDFSSGPDVSGALESVYKSVIVNGSSYNYYYDAFQRRRLKVYFSGESDEYFHTIHDRMLVDQGLDAIMSPTEYVDDNYVWLAGRPVMIVRGKLDLSWDRQTDSSGICTRNGESAACGIYFPVTDHIGKPVLMLDEQRRVAGMGEYDPFGHVNRVSLDAETPHPYPVSYRAAFLDVTQPVGGTSLSLRMRARLARQDTEEGCTNPPLCSVMHFDEINFVDGDTSAVLASGYGGRFGKQEWTPWLSPDAGHLQATLDTGSTNCAPTGSINANRVSCSTSTTYDYQGAVVDAYEYQRFETGATPFWTPLRFPGQYYDAETDLFQNWSRFYDPSVGRYLQAEPLLQDPEYILWSIRGGYVPPAYAYAGHNPLNFYDLDGQAKLPANPSGLGSDWVLDPTHKDPNGQRFRHPSGDVLDFHQGRPGKNGWKGKDHWHHNGADDHLVEGDEIPDPPAQCAPDLQSTSSPSDNPPPSPPPPPDDLSFWEIFSRAVNEARHSNGGEWVPGRYAMP